MEISSKHICLIDDDEIQNFINEKIIQRFVPSAHIVKYLSGQLALDDLRSGKIKPDVILLDINMPIMTGWDFMDIINKEQLHIANQNNIKIFILSSSKDPSDIVKMKDYPQLIDFLHKPLTQNNLQAFINLI